MPREIIYVDEAGVDDTQDCPPGDCHRRERFSTKLETFWVRLKERLGKTLAQFKNLWDAVDEAFRKLP